MLIIHEP